MKFNFLLVALLFNFGLQQASDSKVTDVKMHELVEWMIRHKNLLVVSNHQLSNISDLTKNRLITMGDKLLDAIEQRKDKNRDLMKLGVTTDQETIEAHRHAIRSIRKDFIGGPVFGIYYYRCSLRHNVSSKSVYIKSYVSAMLQSVENDIACLENKGPEIKNAVKAVKQKLWLERFSIAAKVAINNGFL